jgi:protein-S-isoprenylcysteine O-methyltransferase Ste14
MTFTHLLANLAGWSLDLLGLVWLATAVWFAVVRRDTLRGKAWHFLRTLLPEPGMIVGIVVLEVAAYAVPHSIWAVMTWQQSILTDVGVVLVIVGVALMIWARLTLGPMWAGRPMIQDHHELRTDGPYGLVRHPIYTGILAVMFGVTLMAGFGFTAVILAFVVAWLLWRARVDDRILADTFGEPFLVYQAQVPALVPGIRRSTGPADSARV